MSDMGDGNCNKGNKVIVRKYVRESSLKTSEQSYCGALFLALNSYIQKKDESTKMLLTAHAQYVLVRALGGLSARVARHHSRSICRAGLVLRIGLEYFSETPRSGLPSSSINFMACRGEALTICSPISLLSGS